MAFTSPLPLLSVPMNCGASSKMRAMSAFSNPPLAVKNFNPLRFQGKWLAVTITAPSARSCLSTVAINIAGVDAIPKLSTVAPTAAAPLAKACRSAGLEMRESLPTAMVCAVFPFFSPSQATNACAKAVVTSLVRFTLSPSIPSSATPLISEPFCSFFQSIWFLFDSSLYIIRCK